MNRNRTMNTETRSREQDLMLARVDQATFDIKVPSAAEVRFGKEILRSTEGGKALQKGVDIKSRRARREELRHVIKITPKPVEAFATGSDGAAPAEVVSSLACKETEVKDTGTQSEPEQASKGNKRGKMTSHKKRPRRSSIHTTIYCSSSSRRTGNGTSRKHSHVRQQDRTFLAPLRIPSHLLRPVGPGKALREGTEKQTKNLRLLELSELLVDVDRIPMDETLQSRSAVLRINQEYRDGQENHDVEQSSSESTDISSSDEDDSVSEQATGGGDVMHISGFKRTMPHRKISFDGVTDALGTAECAHVSNRGTHVNNLQQSTIRGSPIEDPCPPVPLSPSRTRRGGRRPVPTKPPALGDTGDCETDRLRRKTCPTYRSKKTSLRAPGDTWSEEEDDDVRTRRRRSRRRDHRSRRAKKTSLKLPGDTSSEEDNDDEEVDLRASILFSLPKSFRRRSKAYCLPRKIQDIKRKISRKRSVRPAVKFLKILPRMLPSVKGLLPPARLVPTPSEISVETIVTSNVSGARFHGTTRRQRRASWVAPSPTPPPASMRKDDSSLSPVRSRPMWLDPPLRCTGQREKIQEIGDLAGPITHPIKEGSSGPAYSRNDLKTTEFGETMQHGGEILSRRARRRQDLLKRFERNTLKMTENLQE